MLDQTRSFDQTSLVPSAATARVMQRHRLKYVTADMLSISRRPHGRSFAFIDARGVRITDAHTVRRLKSLAIPPAYREVMCAADPAAHIQAIGRDAAGRLQYRYHPRWEEVREARKARRLLRLLDKLPAVRRHVHRSLKTRQPTRDFALAAVIALVSVTAIRAGRETYARTNGTRGAATLLKSDVTVSGRGVRLSFPGKGGKRIEKTIADRRVTAALRLLLQLPGRRLFQYRNEQDQVVAVRARDVNDRLREIAGTNFSLKDFRTLFACAAVLQELTRLEPAASERARRAQVMQAIRKAADDLVNTPTICRTSYVNGRILDAFADGRLRRLTARPRGGAARIAPERLLATIVGAPRR
jgi:DNA topoisomerase I